jgi:hypothetical protein
MIASTIFLAAMTLQDRDYAHNVVEGWIVTRTPYSTCMMSAEGDEGSELWVTMGTPTVSGRKTRSIGVALYNGRWQNIRDNSIYDVDNPVLGRLQLGLVVAAQTTELESDCYFQHRKANNSLRR